MQVASEQVKPVMAALFAAGIEFEFSGPDEKILAKLQEKAAQYPQVFVSEWQDKRIRDMGARAGIPIPWPVWQEE